LDTPKQTKPNQIPANEYPKALVRSIKTIFQSRSELYFQSKANKKNAINKQLKVNAIGDYSH
jgi:uncharacterized pyridoxamine 5'-phosphate oxidase family protein